jgi:DNA (cytosine-5)-methyltransferase 1
VFVVGCLGDWERAAQVLFERESVQRDSSPRRTPREGAAGNAEGGVGAGRWWDGTDCAGTLTKQNAGGGQRMPDKDNLGAVLQPIGYRWQNNRDGLQQDDAVAAMRASTGGSGFHEMNHPVVVQPVPFTKAKRAQSVTDDETWVDGQVNPTLSLFDQGDTRATTVAVAFQLAGDRSDPTVSVSDAAFCLPANSMSDRGQAVAFHPLQDPISSTDGSTHCMGTGGSQGHASIAVAFQQNQLGEVRCGNIAGTVNTNSNASGRNTPMAMQAMTVRRLTPIECEFLQGFSRNYTLIPWRKKQAEDCPDGPRYKALGNSMAVNCMAWIGERIAALENNR